MPKILVVDDESEVRELVREVLQKKGFGIVTVPDAEQAVERVKYEPYDLIILDIKLAGESGLSVLKKMRLLRTKIPIVVYSGYITPELEKEARGAGATEVLNKTMNIIQLSEYVGKMAAVGDRFAEQSAKKKETPLLIVDDQEEVRYVVGEFFRRKGYKVKEAGSGEEAIGVVRSGDVGAVMLDIRMPGMDGIETLKKMLEIKPGLGVVMVTASQDDKQIRKALDLGAYGYIVKPFDFLYLEMVIASKLTLIGNKP